jgi:hypothetical protein
MSPRRLIVWILALAVVLGFGWYKSVENRRDRERQAAWRLEFARLESEAKEGYRRWGDWLRSLYPLADARQQAADKLNGGRPLTVEPDGDYETARWTDPKYGIELELTFAGDKLVAFGRHFGTGALLAAYPQPTRLAQASRAEAARRLVAQWCVWLWLIALVASIRGRWGRIGAEAMLALTLAHGTARLFRPGHPLTLQGIFSNDPLFFVLLMYLMSLAWLAFQVSTEMRARGRTWRIRFRLRSLLVLTAAIALLLAMGPFGYMSLCAFALGGAWFALFLRVFSSFSTPRVPVKPQIGPSAD